MHHTLKLYGSHRKSILRFYMFFAGWTRIPLLGRLVRNIANTYGYNFHRAYLLTPTEAEELVSVADGVAAGPCACRKTFQKCSHPVDVEIIIGPSRHILLETMPRDSQEISREKAGEILKDSQRRGLILTIVKCREDFYAICSCCSCCCVPLRLSKQYNIGEALVRHRDIVKEFREYQTSYKNDPSTGRTSPGIR